MDSASLAAALRDLPIGPVRYFPATGSTNDEALAWVQAGAPDLALVAAGEQTAGKGRLGRRWLTPPGSALAFSLVLRPGKTGPAWQGSAVAHLTALGALAVTEALARRWNLPAEIKWPNDVLLGGRKTCGILVEVTWQGEDLQAAVLGIGVNVAPASVPPDDQVVFPATCVEAALGRPMDPARLLEAILAELLHWRPWLGQAGFLQAWEDRLAWRGAWVQVIGMEGSVITGQVLGLDPLGGLRLRLPSNQTTTLHSGEVRLRLIDPPSEIG